MSEEMLSADDIKLQRSLYESCRFTKNRQSAVAWMKEVVTIRNLPRDVIDISVQIFDKYLAQSMKDFPEVVFGGVSIPMTAACCLLIGSKVSAGRTSVSMESFPQHSKDSLVMHEMLILERIDFSVLPSIVPSVFVSWLLNFSNDDANNIKTQLKNTAEDLIRILMEWPEYLLYAQSTIAFAALLVAFLHLEIDHSEWLRCVPEDIYCTATSMVFRGLDPSDRMQLLDVGGCLQCFQGLITRARSRPSLPAPPSPLEAVPAQPPDSTEPRDTDSPIGVADLMDISAATMVTAPTIKISGSDIQDNGVGSSSRSVSEDRSNVFSFRPIH